MDMTDYVRLFETTDAHFSSLGHDMSQKEKRKLVYDEVLVVANLLEGKPNGKRSGFWDILKDYVAKPYLSGGIGEMRDTFRRLH